MPDPISELAASKYALLTTYRKDGTPVATPVWIVRLDGALGVWTVADSGKVKRIRRNPLVTVATCDFRGNHAGTAHPGQAELLDPDEAALVRRQIATKYRLTGRIGLLASRIRRGLAGSVGIRITL